MRLYWRVKIDGVWTWRPAVFDFEGDVHGMLNDDDENSVPIGMRCVVWFHTE